jgi:hypothetical protein
MVTAPHRKGILKMHRPLLALSLAVLLFVPASADAAPTLISVGQQDRHPTGEFSAPGADDVVVSYATKPDRGTDGEFLEEHRASSDMFTDDEIAAGRWLDSDRLEPGSYYVLLHAFDFDFECSESGTCMSGFSNVLPLEIPKPAQRYKGTVTRFFTTLDVELTVTPLGETLPYEVCWTKASGRRKCLRSEVDGTSWDDPASDELSVRVRGLRRKTRFNWFVDGKRVASKRVRVPRS